MERLVVGLVELVITIYRGTVVRLTAVGDSIVSLGRRIAHRLRRQPSNGRTGICILIFLCLIYAVKSLGSYF